MRKLTVRLVRDNHRYEPVVTGSFGQRGEKCGEPLRKLALSHDTTHEVRLSHARRQKVLAGGLVREWAVGVCQVERFNAPLQQRLKHGVASNSAPIQHKTECKGRLAVLTRTDRMGQFWKPFADIGDRLTLQRKKVVQPGLRFRRG